MLPLRRQGDASSIYLMQDRAFDLATGEDFAHDFERIQGGFRLRGNPALLPDRVAPSGVLASTRHGANYFHWLVAECLARILLAGISGYSHLPVIIGEMPQQHVDLLKMMWPDRKIEAIGEGELVQFRQLVIPKTAAYTPDQVDPYNATYDIEMVVQIRSRLASICEAHWRSSERRVIYASRSKIPGTPFTASNRRAVNEKAVERALRDAFNARIIHTAYMPIAEQIEAFASASLVIAPAGAALANLIFCREGTPAVIVGQDRHVFPEYFGMLADAVRVPLSYLACPIREGGLPPFHQAYEVPVEVLVGHISTLMTLARLNGSSGAGGRSKV